MNPLEIKGLCVVHEIMMHGLDANPGYFRSGSVGIQRGADIVHIAPPAERILQLMAGLLGWLSTTDEHLLVVSSVFYYEFEFIHPFIDSNGRLGLPLAESHLEPLEAGFYVAAH